MLSSGIEKRDLTSVQNEKPRHKLAHHKGGMHLHDEGNIVPQVLKEMTSKIVAKMVKGDFADLLKISSPAFLHSPQTYL